MRGINSISIIVMGVLLAGCKADMICPAYQSYFLLDEKTQKDQFAYFALDSLPRRDIFNVSKDKNGLVAKNSLLAYVDTDWVRDREIRTVYMDVVYPEISDSTLFAGDAMMYAETDVIDSVALDSARMAAQTFQYNVDQKYYNWYLRGKLVWKDELNKEDGSKSGLEEDKVEKKGFFGFFKNLFKKKDKDTTGQESLGDTVTENIDTEEIGPKKKRLIGKKEKKPKEPKQKKVKPKNKKVDKPIEKVPPAKEEEDDGEDDFLLLPLG